MTDLLNTLSFNVRVTGVTGQSFQSSLRQNVKKPVGSIVYLESPPDDAVKLSYVGSMALSSARDLYIGDRSDELYGNARTGTTSEFLSSSSPISVNTRNFLVTQVFNSTESGKIPLYFKHVFDEDYDAIVSESIKLYDKDFNEVSSDKYKLKLIQEYDEDIGSVIGPSHYELYNNLESYYDAVTGEFAVYFVQYTDNSGSVDVTKTVLLENDKAYNKATQNDIWYITLGLKPWKTVYSIDDNDSGIAVTMPSNGSTSIRYEETKRVRVYGPSETADTSPWYMRVINGSFSSAYGHYTMSYKIPEFSNQAFNPIEPYKLAVFKPSDKISDRLIKLPNEDITFGSLFSSLYIVVQDENDDTVYAITNDETYDGTDYINFDGERVYDDDNNTVKWSTSLFLGVDKLSGIVQVDIDLLDSYKIYTTYTYKEETYSLTSLNMNPIYDQGVMKETRSIYLVPSNCPTNSEATGQTSAICWLKISASGKITEASQDGSGGNEKISDDASLTDTNGYGLTGVVGLHYSWRATTTMSSSQELVASSVLSVVSTQTFPRTGWLRFIDTTGKARYAAYINKTATTLTLSDNSAEVPSSGVFADSTVELVNFIDERSTISTRDYDIELTRVPTGSIPIHTSRYFVLSDLSVNPPHGVNEAVNIDIRQNGGGIIPDKYEEAKLQNPKVQWFSDNGSYDGQVYPGNGAIIIKLPVSIQKMFTDEQIKDIIESNIPYGMVPLIRYYGYQPEITSVTPVASISSLGFGEDAFGSYSFGE